ncbi:MAG: NADH-quinone oxidoreductase subunit L, partial [Planctomycetia bacterium]
LFVFCMTMLVSVSNFLLLYIFWEGVGLCSYFLIGFWYEKPSAAAAGKKAFLVNRVGDFGFAIALLLIWTLYGTFNFHDTDVQGQPVREKARVVQSNDTTTNDSAEETVVVKGVLGNTRLNDQDYVGGSVGLAIGLLLLLGACGKSAQFPLHVWLPDAMEGPTPVSALIHAATMVTAGIYMIARTMPLFLASDGALYIVALLGTISVVGAALIATVQTDLKRILAYSTISQLGYMFLALGAGTVLGVTAGMFHLVTHAFFKALLFLAAGSVMHAMGGIIDVRRFGGLKRLMPITCITFLIGAGALAGLVPFAGFWSKDMILAAVHDGSVYGHAGAKFYNVLYWLAMGAAGVTAYYTLRAAFLTFFGKEVIPKEAGHHAHESPRVMTVPLMILAIFALGAGMVLGPTGWLESFLSRTPQIAYISEYIGHTTTATAHAGEGSHMTVALTSTIIVLIGIGVAIYLYLGNAKNVERLTVVMRRVGIYQLFANKFFIDEIYKALVVHPLALLARLFAWLDDLGIDGLVDWFGRLPGVVGAGLRPLQGGLIPIYALAMMIGLLVLLGILI